MPQRSTGCLTCRRRKIRCDEGRPGCGRCATHGVLCPGYLSNKPVIVEFCDQTASTASRAKHQYKVKAARTVQTQLDLEASPETEPQSPPFEKWGTRNIRDKSVETNIANLSIDKESPSSQALVVQGRYQDPIRLASPAAERANLYGSFIATYLPAAKAGNLHALTSHFGFYRTLAAMQSNVPALQHSFDALSLVQIGSLQKDGRLLEQSIKQYALALGHLSRSIATGDCSDDILAAVFVLSACELYGEIASVGPAEGWSKHIEGASQVAVARGPDSLKSEMALLLYSNMRHGALLHALIARRAPILALPQWRAVAWRTPTERDPSTFFYDIALQIPGLLERHDDINLCSPAAIQTIDQILSDSDELEKELREWYAMWQKSAMEDFGPICELRPIDDFPAFTELCADRTFEHAFMFPDFLVAYLQTLYDMVMHSLRSNTQSLHKARHGLLSEWYPSDAEAVREDELLLYVLNLCQSIPFFCEPMNSSSGSIGIFLPLRTAALYFVKHGNWAYLKWIGAVRNSVFNKGLYPPTVQETSAKGRVSLAQ